MILSMPVWFNIFPLNFISIAFCWYPCQKPTCYLNACLSCMNNCYVSFCVLGSAEKLFYSMIPDVSYNSFPFSTLIRICLVIIIVANSSCFALALKFFFLSNSGTRLLGKVNHFAIHIKHRIQYPNGLLICN